MVGVLDGVELFLKSTCRALEELVDLILDHTSVELMPFNHQDSVKPDSLQDDGSILSSSAEPWSLKTTHEAHSRVK